MCCFYPPLWPVSDIVKRASEASSSLVDGFEPVTDAEALGTARDLAAKEGILSGISGGGTMAAALRVAAKVSAYFPRRRVRLANRVCCVWQAPEGANILAMIPDTAERYMSTVSRWLLVV